MNKKHTTSIILIVVLLVALIGVGGFFLSTYFLADKNPSENPVLSSDTHGSSDASQNVSDSDAVQGDAAAESMQDNANVITREIPEEERPLLLINRMNKLPANYLPYLEETVEGSGIYLEAAAAKAFMRMYTDAFAMGVILTPVDGYRSLERQQNLLNARTDAYIKEGHSAQDAALMASKEKLPAGCSEHNAGLAVDIGVADESFAESAEYKWLQEYAADYGFIERYTADKEIVTDVKAQPWHWRYVGSADMAYAIVESAMSFEEWMAVEYEDWKAAAAENATVPEAEPSAEEETEEGYADVGEAEEDGEEIHEEVYEEEVYEEEVYEDEEQDEEPLA